MSDVDVLRRHVRESVRDVTRSLVEGAGTIYTAYDRRLDKEDPRAFRAKGSRRVAARGIASEIYDRSIDELKRAWSTARRMVNRGNESGGIFHLLDEIEFEYDDRYEFTEALRDALYDMCSEGLT